ncbi:MAG: ribosomal protein large subunit ribosomal protein [Parcubacteria group bacterium]|nr:ribosomal protein large subunit ribosomal protein [Parcubacteria group bacterium]
MQLHTLKRKTANKKSRQVGRGGTRGKTSGRGTKGQNARAGRKKRPELRDFIKRLPKLRGRGVSSFKAFRPKAASVNLNTVNTLFKAGEVVNATSLIERGALKIKKGTTPRVKILGTGELSKKIVFEGVEVSTAAKAKIDAAGAEIK